MLWCSPTFLLIHIYPGMKAKFCVLIEIVWLRWTCKPDVDLHFTISAKCLWTNSYYKLHAICALVFFFFLKTHVISHKIIRLLLALFEFDKRKKVFKLFCASAVKWRWIQQKVMLLCVFNMFLLVYLITFQCLWFLRQTIQN